MQAAIQDGELGSRDFSTQPFLVLSLIYVVVLGGYMFSFDSLIKQFCVSGVARAEKMILSFICIMHVVFWREENDLYEGETWVDKQKGIRSFIPN